jgi:transcriptional regulator with XRE-family HTH domain
MDHPKIAAEWLRALRGRRSQLAFSRRLGYRSNIAARWEAGRCWPTAAKVLASARSVGLDVRACLRAFFRVERPWLEQLEDPCSPETVAALLQDLRGTVPLVDLAHATGFSRFRIARWLQGDAQPKLPEFLALIDGFSMRLLDFLAAFTDPALLPSLGEAWRQQNAARDAAFERPWSHAVLRALELDDYDGRDRFLATRLGLPAREVARCLKVLERAGQVQQSNGRWLTREGSTLDLRSDPERLRGLKAFWLDVARTRLTQGSNGVFGFNLFACSLADLQALRELYLAYYQQMQARIAQSSSSECVALFSTQLLRLDQR